MMWWIPLLTAVGIALALALAQYWYSRYYVSFYGSYERQFEALVVRLERVTLHVNRMAIAIDHIKDERLLSYYESCLRLLENLLTAIKDVPESHHADHATLKSATFLARECEKRVVRTQKAFATYLRGQAIDLSQLYGRITPKFPVGCYFCSRPYDPRGFRKVKVKVDEDIRSVHGCSTCREELENSKKVKVLYFMRDNEPVHWSELPDYTPSRDFYDINKRKKYGESTLRLIYSRSDGE